MEYKRLPQAGTLEIEVPGRPLDIAALGIVQLNLQEVLEKVAYATLNPFSYEDFYFRVRAFPPSPYRAPRLIRAELVRIQSGSFLQEIAFSVAYVAAADPATVAILQNLAANVIWAIASSGFRRIRSKLQPNVPTPNVPHGLFEIGPNLRDMILGVAENDGNGRIVFRHRRPDGQVDETEIDFSAEHDDSDSSQGPSPAA